MGKNNQARRAARARQRAAQRRASSGTSRTGPGSPFGSAEAPPRPGPRERVVDELIRVEQFAVGGLAKFDLEVVIRTSAERLAAEPVDVVDRVLGQLFESYLTGIWAAGWQPAELRREAQRSAPGAAARLIELAILHDAQTRSGPVDPRWSAQLAEFSSRSISTRDGLLRRWRQHEHLDVVSGHGHALMAICAMVLPKLDVLIPPPGTRAGATSVAGEPAGVGQAEHPVLRRVRKLLSKAESTEYEHEAEVLTAKAHELMVRHAIDQAALAAPAPSGPVLARYPVDAPYSDAKSLLLGEIAEAYRCRAVHLKNLAMSTVVGHPGDLRIVEMLFTSLLVQAQNSLNVASRAGAGPRSRSQAFRASFYVAYARRIGERLAAVEEQVFVEAGEAGRSALPVLRDRERAVADAFEERFGGSLVTSAIRGGYDTAGAATGRRAADAAALDSGALTR